MPVLTFDLDFQRRDIDVSKEIARYVPDETPWTVMLLQARKKATRTAEFYWWEEPPYGYWTQINNAAGYLATDTSLVVDDATIFAPKDITRNARVNYLDFLGQK